MATNQSPQVSVPVPSSLSRTTPNLPPLSSQLLVQHLRQDTNTIPDLQDHLSDSLARAGWTDRVKALAAELLKSGKCESFPELFEEVLHRVKAARDSTTSTRDVSQAAGTSVLNGNGSIAVREGWFGPDGLPDVKIPVQTVESGVEFLKEKVKDAIEIVDDD